MKRFATAATPNDDSLANLQRAMWDAAVEHFGRLKARGGQGDFTESEFASQAAVVVVLAGASISNLLGQNSEPSDSGRTQSLGAMITDRNGPEALRRFNTLYEAVRHFGPVKHTEVTRLLCGDRAPEHLCELLNAVGEAWRSQLGGQTDTYPSAAYHFSFDGWPAQGTMELGDGA